MPKMYWETNTLAWFLIILRENSRTMDENTFDIISGQLDRMNEEDRNDALCRLSDAFSCIDFGD